MLSQPICLVPYADKLIGKQKVPARRVEDPVNVLQPQFHSAGELSG